MYSSFLFDATGAVFKLSSTVCLPDKLSLFRSCVIGNFCLSKFFAITGDYDVTKAASFFIFIEFKSGFKSDSLKSFFTRTEKFLS